jgi:hypothetical protein
MVPYLPHARSARQLLIERLLQSLCKIASHERNGGSQIVRRVKNYIPGHSSRLLNFHRSGAQKVGSVEEAKDAASRLFATFRVRRVKFGMS